MNIDIVRNSCVTLLVNISETIRNNKQKVKKSWVGSNSNLFGKVDAACPDSQGAVPLANSDFLLKIWSVCRETQGLFGREKHVSLKRSSLWVLDTFQKFHTVIRHW